MSILPQVVCPAEDATISRATFVGSSIGSKMEHRHGSSICSLAVGVSRWELNLRDAGYSAQSNTIHWPHGRMLSIFMLTSDPKLSDFTV